MVTVQELEQQEQAARAIANQPIPKRRFGSRITAQDQQRVIQEKQQAQQKVNEIQVEKQRLQEEQNRPVARELTREEKIREAASKALSSRRRRVPDADQLGFTLTREERNEVVKIIGEAEDRAERQQGQIAVAEYKRGVQEASNQSLVFSEQELSRVAKEAVETGFIKIQARESQAGYMSVNSPQMSFYTLSAEAGLPTNAPGAFLGEKITNTAAYRKFSALYRKEQERKKQEEIRGAERQLENEGYVKGSPEFKAEYTRRERNAEIATELGTALFFSIGGVPKLNTGLVTVATRQAQGLKYSNLIEGQVEVMSGGKRSTLTVYNIVTERVAPKAVFDTKGPGGFLGETSQLERIRGAKYEITRTVIPVVNEGKVITLTTRNAKEFTLDVLQGKSSRVNIKDMSNLNNIQKFLFQRLAETKTGGRAVSVDNLSNFLSKLDDFSTSSIIKTKQGIAPKLTGKSTERFITVSRNKLILETDQFEVFSTKVLFKDITFPLARGRGRTPEIRGFIVRTKEPIILDDFKDVNIMRPTGGKKTPLSVTFQKQLLDVAKPVPKIVKTKALNKNVLPKINGVPSVSLGVVTGFSLRSSYGSASDFRIAFDLARPNAKATQTPKVNYVELSITGQVSSGIPRVTSVTKSIAREIPREIAREVSREIIREIQRQSAKSITKQVSKLTAKSTSKTPGRGFPKIPRTRPGKAIPTINIDIGLKKPSINILQPGFKTFYFSKGKKIYLPGISGRQEAIFKGQTITLKTLSARFGIEKTRVKVKAKSVNTGNMFNRFFREFKVKKGKAIRTPNTYIQKRGTRLSTRDEIKAIQKALKFKRIKI